MSRVQPKASSSAPPQLELDTRSEFLLARFFRSVRQSSGHSYDCHGRYEVGRCRSASHRDVLVPIPCVAGSQVEVEHAVRLPLLSNSRIQVLPCVTELRW